MNAVANMNPERTNRWLLIGAAVLALVAGVIVFIALNSTSDGGGTKTTTVTGGDTPVLVAKQAIAANSRLTADEFELRTLPAAAVIANPVSDLTAVDGKVTSGEILKGEQLSYGRLGVETKYPGQLSPKIAAGMRALSVRVSSDQIVSGLIVPDDRVDVMVTFTDRLAGETNVTRVQTVLQNVRVLALATTTIGDTPGVDTSATPAAQPTATTLGTRPEDVKPNPSAGTATLELTPEQGELLLAAADKGRLTLALRGIGDDTPTNQPPVYFGEHGQLPAP